MTADLLENVKEALQHLPAEYAMDGWTVQSHFAGCRAKAFISNSWLIQTDRLGKNNLFLWKHVASEENPADTGSRGCHESKLSSVWSQGQERLKEKGLWPPE